MNRLAEREPVRTWGHGSFSIGVLSVLGGLATLILVATPPAQTGDPTVDVAARLWLVTCTALVLIVVWSPASHATKGLLISVLVGSALMVGAALILSANDFAPFGATLDQSHRTAMITKYAHNWGWVDFAYKGLPVYYPPLSFWILGRLAALLSVAPWKMLKVDVLATAFLVPVLGWTLWGRLVGRTAGVAAVVASALVFQSWYRPMAWLGVALFVPWWLWGVLGVDRHVRSRLELAVCALIGAALFCTYYFVFFIGIIMLALVLGLRRPAAARGVDLPPRNLKATAVVLGGSAIFSAPYWGPILVSVIRNGYQENSNRFYISDFFNLRLRFLTLDVLGIVMLLGLAYLLVTARRSQLSLGLLGLLGAALAYYVADYAGFLAHFPLLSFESNELIDAILGFAAGLGAVHVWEITRSNETLRVRLGRGGITTVFVVTGTLVSFSLAQSAIKSIPYVSEQRQAQDPTPLLTDFRRAAGGPIDNRVVLTNVAELPAFLPVYVFNWWNTLSQTTPAARVNDRTAFLERLSTETDHNAFAVAMLHNVYDRIDFVVLRPGAAGQFSYEFTDDAFPKPPVPRIFQFDGALFSTPTFRRVDTPSFTVFRISRSHDPLDALRSCVRMPKQRKCALLARVATRYRGDVDGTVLQLAARWASASRGA